MSSVERRAVLCAGAVAWLARSARGAQAGSGAAPGTLAAGPEWGSLGLVMAIVGSFLIASGILFRDPRSLLEERFGQAALRLRTIRELVFHRVQMALGFVFLIGGFALQLLGRAAPVGAAGAAPAAEAGGGSTALWIGGILALVILLEIVGWWWSMHSIRSATRRWLREHPAQLDGDPGLAREVGELFGIASHVNDTVPSYVARLRRALGLPAPAGLVRERREPELVAED